MVIKYLIGRTAGGSAKSTEFMSHSTTAESRRCPVLVVHGACGRGAAASPSSEAQSYDRLIVWRPQIAVVEKNRQFASHDGLGVKIYGNNFYSFICKHDSHKHDSFIHLS